MWMQRFNSTDIIYMYNKSMLLKIKIMANPKKNDT